MKTETIHKSLINSQRRQMVKQIQEYGLYDFWSDYVNFLDKLCVSEKQKFDYFTDVVISYFRIIDRY